MKNVTLETFLSHVAEVKLGGFQSNERILKIATEYAESALECYNFAAEVAKNINTGEGTSQWVKVTYSLSNYYGDAHQIFIETPEGIEYSVTPNYKNPKNFTIAPVVAYKDKGFMSIKDRFSQEINGGNAKRTATRLKEALTNDVEIFKIIRLRKEAKEIKDRAEKGLFDKMNEIATSHRNFVVSSTSDTYNVEDKAVTLSIKGLSIEECLAIQSLIRNMRKI